MQTIFQSAKTLLLQKRLSCTYLSLVIIGTLSLWLWDWTKFWNFLRIPTIFPYFGDLRTIQGAVLGDGNGLDPQIQNPNNPWGTPMNYPKIWVIIGKIFHIQSETGFFIFGSLIVALFLISALHFLWHFPSTIALLAFCSFSTLLGIERGNNDLFLFVLIYIGILAGNNWGRAAIFLIALILKIFPIFALIGFRLNLKQTIFLIGVCATYLAVIFDQLSAISAGNSAEGTISYGFNTSKFFLERILSHKIGLAHKNLLLMSLILLGMTFVVILYLLWKRLIIPVDFGKEMDYRKTNMFLSGAGVYCGTFIFASNWDYRLIFLILCLPFLIQIPNRFFNTFLPCLFLVAMNSIPLSLALHWVIIDLISNTAKIFIFFSLLIIVFSIARVDFSTYLKCISNRKYNLGRPKNTALIS